MTEQVESQTSKFDGLKWIVVFGLMAATIAGFYYFTEQGMLVRVAGLLVGLGAAVAIALATGRGRDALEFSKEARTEVRKVVWPTRQETVQTTLVIAAFVVVMSLLLWGVDAILVLGINFITGQGA